VSGQGIGRAIALRLADDGFDVAVNDVELGELGSLVEEIKSKGRQSSIHIGDVSMEDSAKKMVEDVVNEHGGLDIVSWSCFSLRTRFSVFTYFKFGTDGCKFRYREIERDS
jgi:NAD(P)-dependent dehydrogenase (short-subunit alcohol dehydrogenase family)